MINKTLRKLKTRNTQSNIKQFLAVILIVFLSTVLFLGFAVNWWSLKKSVDLYYEETKLANLWVDVNNISEGDEKFFDKNVLEYDKRLTFKAETVIKDGASVASEVYVSDGKLNTPYVSVKTQGCFIDKQTATDNEIVFGFDTLIVDYNLNGENIQLEFEITGTMNFSERIFDDGVKPVFIDETVFLNKINSKLEEKSQQIKTSVDYNQILVKCDNVEKMKSMINKHYQTSGSSLKLVYGRECVDSVIFMNEEIQNAKLIMILFASIFIVVSILLVLATINQFIIQEKPRIGTFKSLGIENSKIVKFYSGFGSNLCFIGAIIGAVLSPIIVPSVMMATYENVYLIPNEYLKLKLPIALMIVTILAFTVCGFIITCCQISRVVKGNPVDCFNDAPKLRKNRAKIKENVSKMPLFIKSAFRNMKQNIARNVMMLVGVFGSVSLLFTSFSVSSSLSISNLSTEKRFDGIYSLMGIVRVFAILLVIVVVVGSLMMILRDRKKEIATFKLLGIKKNTMIWSLVAEIAIVLVVGFMMGIFGGVGLSFLTLKTLHMFGVVAAFSLNFMDIFLSFLIPFLVALLLILYSIIWIKKLNALETLKTIE